MTLLCQDWYRLSVFWFIHVFIFKRLIICFAWKQFLAGKNFGSHGRGSDNIRENLATWLFENLSSRKTITSHHSHSSCRGQWLFLSYKDDAGLPLKTFQSFLIILKIKSKLLIPAFAYSPGLTSYSPTLSFFWFLRHKPAMVIPAFGHFQWLWFPFSPSLLELALFTLRSFFKAHFLRKAFRDYSICCCLFLSHDPILFSAEHLLVWYIFIYFFISVSFQ